MSTTALQSARRIKNISAGVRPFHASAATQAQAQGELIRMDGEKMVVPSNPIIPFIEGDGTGPDIWSASVKVFDAAVAKAYGGERKIHWREVLAGEKAFRQTGSWLPQETLDECRQAIVSIKGPLTTPIGGGMRSLNVALRQELDLYVCLVRCLALLSPFLLAFFLSLGTFFHSA